MTDEEREELSRQSTSLRLELKAWEKTFAAANNGKKASRDDIKNNPEIGILPVPASSANRCTNSHLAQKYKDYNKLRDLLSGKISKEPPPRQSSRKRKKEAEPLQVVSKRQHVMKTPSKTSPKPWEVDPYESPTVRNLFTPSKRTVIGPTPQRDGQVLGIFDLLQEAGTTPTRAADAVGTQTSIQATPRKSPGDATLFLKHSRTPASSGKRYMLDKFATPLKSLNPNGQGGTPSSVSKLHFSTPSFLRRDSHRPLMPVVKENEEITELSPQMVRVPRKPLVRGLSSMLASLRKMEEDALDEDLEALHEMENEEAGISNPAPKVTVTAAQEAVLVEDSQPGFPLGGFDDEAMFDSDPEEVKNPTLGRDGQPLKVYKKKGQKRTTRRVKMKPSRSKPAPQPTERSQDDSEDELTRADEEVPETQVDQSADFADARNFDSDSQSEYTASEGGTRYRRPDQSKKKKMMTKDGKIRTVARKVTAVAHQNFKRLKLLNSGAKGGVAHNSRFRRKK